MLKKWQWRCDFTHLKGDEKANLSVAVQNDGSLIATVLNALIHGMSASKCNPNILWVFLPVPINPMLLEILSLQPPPQTHELFAPIPTHRGETDKVVLFKGRIYVQSN